MVMSIGELARRAGCSVPTVRFYESVGLIPKASRGSNGRRTYGWPDVSRLTFVRRARSFGLSVEQVRALLNVDTGSDADCEPAKEIIAAQLEQVRARRAELTMLERSLKQMLDRCESGCCTASGPCSIMTDIQAP